MDILHEIRDLLSECCCWRKPSRYGYSVIRARRSENYTETSQISLQSHLSSVKPISENDLENIYDSQDEIIVVFKNLQTSRILLELPTLARRLNNQLADFVLSDDQDQIYVGNEREDILKQNLLYLASWTENVEQLTNELWQRRVLKNVDVVAINALRSSLLKALEIFKLVLNQRDSLGFLIGALKVTGSYFVADIFVGNFPDVDTELICKISLTPEFSPEFILRGTMQKYRVLRKISRERQEILTSVTCSFIEFKGKTLLKSLEHCKNLHSIKLTDVKLKKDFPRKISLPSLKRFVFHINKSFPTKKDFFDNLEPAKILNLLFFIQDENNNNSHYLSSLFFGPTDQVTRTWHIQDLWNMNIDIVLKMGGRTVLLIDHVKSRLFSRVENYYKIPENVIQPSDSRNLSLGWINHIAKSSVPLNLTKLSLYSIQSINSTKNENEINYILKYSSHLREFRLWNTIAAQPWTILKFSCLPSRLKILAASFIEIEMDDDESSSSPSRLDHLSLFFYKIVRETDEENRTKFLNILARNCKTVSLISFPPHNKEFSQDDLFSLMQGVRINQILLSGCEHSLNFEDHWLFFRRDVLESIKKSNSFILNKNGERPGWTGRPVEKQEVIQHLYARIGFDILYSYDTFVQHEILKNLWKFFK